MRIIVIEIICLFYEFSFFYFCYLFFLCCFMFYGSLFLISAACSHLSESWKICVLFSDLTFQIQVLCFQIPTFFCILLCTLVFAFYLYQSSFTSLMTKDCNLTFSSDRLFLNSYFCFPIYDFCSLFSYSCSLLLNLFFYYLVHATCLLVIWFHQFSVFGYYILIRDEWSIKG